MVHFGTTLKGGAFLLLKESFLVKIILHLK
jgi:hypothetical protein